MDFGKTGSSKLLCVAGCALIAAVSAGAEVVSQPFATATADLGSLTSGTWTGNGSVTNNTTALYTANTTVGKPIAGATDNNVLSVEGKVTCAAVTTGPTAVDMMVQISKPDEALEALTDADVTFAVGVDLDGKINVFCGSKGGTGNAWRVLGAAYEEGSWHRVSLRFDYSNGTCEVCVDGDPQVSANGYLTSDKKAGDGCWYPLAKNKDGLASVQVVGTTAIDEVVVKSGTTLAEVLPAFPEPPAPAGDVTIDGVTVPVSWRVANGIPSSMTVAPDGSGMTVKAKYVTGISPLSGEKFEIKAMAPSADGLTLTVPAAKPAAGCANVIEVKDGGTVVTTTQIPQDATSVTVATPAATTGAVKYTYQIKTVTTAK